MAARSQATEQGGQMTSSGGEHSVLVGGDWQWPMYEEALANGFREIGWNVSEFRQRSEGESSGSLGSKLLLSPFLRELNARFVETVEQVKPDLVLLQRCGLLLPDSIRKVAEVSPGSRVFLFHNDDPFVRVKRRVVWRNFLHSIPYADATLVFRPVNVEEAKRFGARVVEVLPPYYVKSMHYPVANEAVDYDVVYVGHYETDGRADMVEALAAAGLRVGLFGTAWEGAPASCAWIHSQQIVPVRGDEYRRTLSRALMAIAFISKRNRDVWTTRCFEIPACRVAMLTPDNAHMRSFFGEDEVIYYEDGNVEDIVAKAVAWSQQPDRCRDLAEAGWRRCTVGGHSEVDRARQIADLWERIVGGGSG